MNKRFKIVNKDGESPFLTDREKEYGNLPIENVDCPALQFLLSYANEHEHYNGLAVDDYFHELEQNLAFIERLNHDQYATSLHNIPEPNNWNHRRDIQFLRKANSEIYDSFKMAWNCIEWIRGELKLDKNRNAQDCCCECDSE